MDDLTKPISTNSTQTQGDIPVSGSPAMIFGVPLPTTQGAPPLFSTAAKSTSSSLPPLPSTNATNVPGAPITNDPTTIPNTPQTPVVGVEAPAPTQVQPNVPAVGTSALPPLPPKQEPVSTNPTPLITTPLTPQQTATTLPSTSIKEETTPVVQDTIVSTTTEPSPEVVLSSTTDRPGNAPELTGTVTGATIEQTMQEPTIEHLLNLVNDKNASDLHLVVGYPAMIRIDGDLVNVSPLIMSPELVKKLLYSVLPDEKKEQLEINREVDLAYAFGNVGRFRINAYWQRGYLAGAFRLIPKRIRTIDELKLPPLFHKLADLEQGLVLVTGPTGHGKSTTLAAIIQEINERHPKHILTIEDPIEYVFPPMKALVSQREIGDDTHSWKGALRVALREDPDVVLVGEMRDLETISSAITVAETGHTVFATLHTNNAAQTIQRIINMYPDVQQEEVRSELADILEAVVAQRLIPVKGGGRRAAIEVMLMTPAIRNLIRENKIYQIDNVIRTSLDLGMITLERSLLNLFKDGLIAQEDALRYALDATEMARLLEELV